MRRLVRGKRTLHNRIAKGSLVRMERTSRRRACRRAAHRYLSCEVVMLEVMGETELFGAAHQRLNLQADCLMRALVDEIAQRRHESGMLRNL